MSKFSDVSGVGAVGAIGVAGLYALFIVGSLIYSRLSPPAAEIVAAVPVTTASATADEEQVAEATEESATEESATEESIEEPVAASLQETVEDVVEEDVAEEEVVEEEAADPEQIPYMDPPDDPPTEEAMAALAALKAEIPNLDYQRARYHPLHFKPAIDTASDEQCLACHQEVLSDQLRETSVAGVAASTSLAWYQTLATYQEEQMTFHQRHLTSAYAQSVMKLKCNFCHQGNDPREEAPQFGSGNAGLQAGAPLPFTYRKMVNPSTTCLLCHGAMPDQVEIMTMPGPWLETRPDLESEDAPNGCLSCHGEGLFRTNRHNVTYLKAASIEKLAELGSDVCYGCHGGRAWYRIAYPYPRHPYPGMDMTETPEWAQGRPAESDARYILQQAKP